MCKESGKIRFQTIQTEIQRTFINKVRVEGIDRALPWLKSVQGEREFSYPEKLVLKWEGDKAFYRLEISETEDFAVARVIQLQENSCVLENLKIGWKYYWRVDGGQVQTFETENGEWRFIRIDGLRNVRDLGGRKIKQGLVYRGSETDGRNYRITEQGKKVFRDELKIKTELDLRAEYFGCFVAPIEGVELKQIPYRPYIEVFEEKHRREVVEIMTFLSDENVYPLYFHCMGGADRTGMIALYLQALVGEKEADIFLDYELTSLARIPQLDAPTTVDGYRSRNSDYFVAFLNELQKYAPSQGLQSQVRAFLKDCGVSDSCMNKIVEILKK